MDGYRALVCTHDGRLRVRSRRGWDMTDRVPELALVLLLRRFPKTGWYGPQGVAASRSMTKTQLYASTVAKRLLATVEDDNDPSNTWSKWATQKNC